MSARLWARLQFSWKHRSSQIDPEYHLFLICRKYVVPFVYCIYCCMHEDELVHLSTCMKKCREHLWVTKSVIMLGSHGSPGSLGFLFDSMVAGGSMGSMGSVDSVASIVSKGSIGSIGSIGSLGSISSVGSSGCVGSWCYVGSLFCLQSRGGEGFAHIILLLRESASSCLDNVWNAMLHAWWWTSARIFEWRLAVAWSTIGCQELLLCRKHMVLRLMFVNCVMQDDWDSLDSTNLKDFSKSSFDCWRAPGICFSVSFQGPAGSFGLLCARFPGSPGSLVPLFLSFSWFPWSVVPRVPWFPGLPWCTGCPYTLGYLGSHGTPFPWFSWLSLLPWFPWFPWFTWFRWVLVPLVPWSLGSSGSPDPLVLLFSWFYRLRWFSVFCRFQFLTVEKTRMVAHIFRFSF